MDYKVLGRSGLRVSELALGAVDFGPDRGWGADEDASKAQIDANAAAGGNPHRHRQRSFWEDVRALSRRPMEPRLTQHRTRDRPDGGRARDGPHPRGVLAGGVLTGKYGSRKDRHDTFRSPEGGWPAEPHEVALGETICSVAEAQGVDPAQVAIAWVQQPTRRAIPLIAARKPEHITENLGASTVKLANDPLRRLDAVNHIRHESPMRIQPYDNIRDAVNGHPRAKRDDHHTPIDDHRMRTGRLKSRKDPEK